jgi:glutathione synthase/RimK-type ligase-like ATP-grasp enzyme
MNQELLSLFSSDQLERQDFPAHGTPAFLALQDRDRERRRRVNTIVATEGLDVPADYYHAAMVLLHGESSDEIWRAYTLASHAAKNNYRPARWLSAAAYDRWLMYQGRPQMFGTQIVPDGHRFRLWDVDQATTDADRAAWDVPPLGEMGECAEELSRTKPLPAPDRAPAWLKEAIRRWDARTPEDPNSRAGEGAERGNPPSSAGSGPGPLPLLFAEEVPAKHLQPPPGYDITHALARLLGRAGVTGQRDKVLILASSTDPHADAVALELAGRGSPVRRLTWPRCRLSLRMGADLSRGGASLIESPADDLALDEVKSVWLRSTDLLFDRTNEDHDDVDAFMRRESDAVFKGLCSLLDSAFWVSHPNAIQAANNKLDQLQVAASLGLIVPRTLVTNDPQQARDFYDECSGDMILKTFTGWLGPISQSPRAVYTTRVLPEHLADFDRVHELPCLFQEYVPKDVELRITVIGERVFAAEIHSQRSPVSKDDWRRYDLANTPYCAAQLPVEIETACRRILGHYGLSFGAIDMIRRPDGAYVFVELNPNGQWLWIQDLTHLPLVEAMADLLAGGSA